MILALYQCDLCGEEFHQVGCDLPDGWTQRPKHNNGPIELCRTCSATYPPPIEVFGPSEEAP